MFQSLQGGVRLHGIRASLLWSYHTAAHLGPWTIRRTKQGEWVLSAALGRVDRFQVRQTPLLFTAPRGAGFWCWGVESIEIGTDRVVAKLGPPEQ